MKKMLLELKSLKDSHNKTQEGVPFGISVVQKRGVKIIHRSSPFTKSQTIERI
jgi:hypothetical protein